MSIVSKDKFLARIAFACLCCLCIDLISLGENDNENTNVNTINFSPKNNTTLHGRPQGLVGAPNPAPGNAAVLGSPSAYANVHLFHSPWNFTPPNLLFHPTKTLNDNSPYHLCRMINTGVSVRDSFRDKVMGIYDEREHISAMPAPGLLNKVKSKFSNNPNNPLNRKFNQVIVCGLNATLPRGCVTFMGTAHVYNKDYASTEAALNGLAQLAAKKGANLVGHVNCAYAESIHGINMGAGASLGGVDSDHDSAGSGSLGLSWGNSRVTRPAHPHCSGDLYLATMCTPSSPGSGFMQPRPYRRYLPVPPRPLATPPSARQRATVRGLW